MIQFASNNNLLQTESVREMAGPISQFSVVYHSLCQALSPGGENALEKIILISKAEMPSP
tara:strand:- start:806 stop:985 length:180 start_codon:yes stop_codon:yes gene_type:complete